MIQLLILEDDITRHPAEALVRPASHGRPSGAEAAILDAAGPDLAAALSRRAAQRADSPFVTPGFRLPARLVIHVAAPRRGARARPDETDALYDFHRHGLELAAAHAVRSLAFPAVGAGLDGWPFRVAALAAMEAVSDWVGEGRPRPERLSFVCASPAVAGLYRHAARDWGLGRLMDVGEAA